MVLTTLPADADTQRFAETLINERLAACVSAMGTMESTYRWDGSIRRDSERQIVIKTTRDRLQALEARFRDLHPYDVPEFVILSVSASTQYGNWVARETVPQ